MTLVTYLLISTGAFLFFVVAAVGLMGADVLQTVHEQNALRFRQLKRYLAMHLLRAFLFGLPLALFGTFAILQEDFADPSLSVRIRFISLLVLWWVALMLGLIFLAIEFLNVLWRGDKAP